MKWFLKVVRDNYANFNGRARRKEYWMFTLFYFIFNLVVSSADRIFSLNYGDLDTGVLSSIYGLALFIPSLAVTIRRLHDTGKSGWNYLWIFTIIGAFYVLYLLIKEGDFGQNEYGADPKGEDTANPFDGQSNVNNPFSGPNNPFANDNNPFRNPNN
ncbi:DUF805 domain-containing protein [Sphingobacterium sp. Mn56C]|uniref:DUF805 domain-containing protein n=1 Tax=Sphingobacterium sp. Mn56C TaxID=3395261 RepID=UPI003BC4F730